MNKRLIILLFFHLICEQLYGQGDCFVICNTKLYRFQTNGCESQFIGDTGIGLLDIALTDSRKLYGTDGTRLYQIDTITASLTYLYDIGVPLIEIYNNLMAINNDFLIAQNSNLELIKIKIDNGNKILIGNLNYYSSGDLTFHNGYFYLSAMGNQLVKIKLNSNETAVISEELVGIMDTNADNVYGILSMGSTDCKNETTKIFAFENLNVYEVNPENAAATIVCDSLFSDPATGAASLSEVYSFNSNIEINIPNIFTPNNDGINDTFRTNFKLVDSFSFEIYNRWGNIIYKSNKNTDWNGFDMNGNICGEGIYFYVLSFQNICKKNQVEKGFIQLFK